MQNTREVALLYLGLNPSNTYSKEDLSEALDEAIYKEKVYFLNRDFSAKLATSRINKISNLFNLESELLGKPEKAQDIQSLVLKVSSSLSEFVGNYNILNSRFKLELSSSHTCTRIVEIYIGWIRIYNEFAKVYTGLIESEIGYIDADVSIRSVDYVKLINELKNRIYNSEALILYNQLKNHNTIAS